MTEPTWTDRINKAKKKYPHIEDMNWSAVLRDDPMVMAKIVSDIMRIDPSGQKKRIKTKSLTAEHLKRVLSESYSEEDFYTTFAALTRGQTVRAIAKQCNLDHMYVNRLQHKKIEPSIEALEKIAKGYGKNPSFFREYRIYHILNSIGRFLETAPETSVNLYVKLKGK